MYYDPLVLQHFHTPRYGGSLPAAEGVYHCRVGTLATDIIALYIQINSQHIIQAARFKAQGCPVTIACASLLTEWLLDKSITKARTITSQNFITALNLTKEKMHCALLAEDALHALLMQLS